LRRRVADPYTPDPTATIDTAVNSDPGGDLEE
jgi:hypothetical protein